MKEKYWSIGLGFRSLIGVWIVKTCWVENGMWDNALWLDVRFFKPAWSPKEILIWKFNLPKHGMKV